MQLEISWSRNKILVGPLIPKLLMNMIHDLFFSEMLQKKFKKVVLRDKKNG